MRQRIGGALDYSLLATQHRPQSREALALEAYRLVRTYRLSPYDIAMCLGVTVETVSQCLGERVTP